MTFTGEITLGTIVAFVQYLFMIIWPMKILGRLVVELGKSSVSWKRINKILNTPSDNINKGLNPESKLNGKIEFRNVTFEYEKDLPVIKNFNMVIDAGEKLALIGHTGSGKSTIVNLLSGFYPIKSGEVLIDGVNINDYSKSYLNDQIGLIHQEGFLFSKSIKENIAFARKGASDEEVIDAAKRADIHESIMSFPDNYQTIVGEKGVTLSGGQKQRVTIARTILKDPSILILDDSLSAVDTETEERIQKALDEVMEDRTSIIIGHRITSIMKADKIIVLEDGEIAQQGTHEELISEEGIYKSIFDIQSKIEEEIEKEVSANG
jgi:ATP-binding cassette subfamily B protein